MAVVNPLDSQLPLLLFSHRIWYRVAPLMAVQLNLTVRSQTVAVGAGCGLRKIFIALEKTFCPALTPRKRNHIFRYVVPEGVKEELRDAGLDTVWAVAHVTESLLDSRTRLLKV